MISLIGARAVACGRQARRFSSLPPSDGIAARIRVLEDMEPRLRRLEADVAQIGFGRSATRSVAGRSAVRCY